MRRMEVLCSPSKTTGHGNRWMVLVLKTEDFYSLVFENFRHFLFLHSKNLRSCAGIMQPFVDAKLLDPPFRLWILDY